MNGGKLVIGTELKNDKFDKQIKLTKRELESLEKDLSDLNSWGVKKTSEEFMKLEAQIEKTRNAYNKLKREQVSTSLGMVKNIQYNENTFKGKSFAIMGSYSGGGSVRNIKGDLYTVADTYKDIHAKITESAEETKKLTNETNKLGTTNTKVFEKGVKTLKRFALGIVGIRSAYLMARRAASSYMAQDEELSNKVKSFWIGLGSFLAPILEMLSDVMLKALGYLNVFIKALTGIDYIARANAKALKKQADATKQATNALSSLDEIENIDLGSKMDEKSLADFGYIDIPELDPKVVKKLEDMAKWLKENWDWIQKVGEVLLLVFAGSIAWKVLQGIGNLIGFGAAGGLGSGLAGLLALLGAIAVVWTIKLVMDGKEAIEDFIKSVDDWKNNNVEAIDEYHKETKKKGKETKEDAKALGQYLIGNTRRLGSELEGIEKQKNLFTDLTGETGKLNKEQQDLIKNAGKSADEMIRLKKEGKLTQEQEEEFATTLRNLITEADSLGLSTDKLKKKYKNLTGEDYKIKVLANVQEAFDKFKEIKNAAKEVGNSKYTIQSDVDNQAINKLLGTIEALEKASESGSWALKSINKAKLWAAKAQLYAIRGYAQGGLVTQPTRALIGEAGYNEYVVPERSDYLSRLANNIIENMPAGGLSDDLLLELNRNITELANRPIVINVDGKALAQATYQDFKNEENRLNSSTSVSVK